MYIGVDSLLHPHSSAEIHAALLTLGLSACVEGTTLWVAYKSVARAADRLDMNIRGVLKTGLNVLYGRY